MVYCEGLDIRPGNSRPTGNGRIKSPTIIMFPRQITPAPLISIWLATRPLPLIVGVGHFLLEQIATTRTEPDSLPARSAIQRSPSPTELPGRAGWLPSSRQNITPLLPRTLRPVRTEVKVLAAMMGGRGAPGLASAAAAAPPPPPICCSNLPQQQGRHGCQQKG